MKVYEVEDKVFARAKSRKGFTDLHWTIADECDRADMPHPFIWLNRRANAKPGHYYYPSTRPKHNYPNGKIELRPDSQHWVALHECAHHLCSLYYATGFENEPGYVASGHCAEWAEIYVALVRRYYPASYGDRLEAGLAYLRPRYPSIGRMVA